MTQTPEPLTETELEQVRKRHIDPQPPGYCAGGFKLRLSRDYCQTCGATDNDTCGRWVGYATEDIPRLLSTISHLNAELAEAKDAVRRLEQMKFPGGTVAIHVARKIFRHGMLKAQEELAKLRGPVEPMQDGRAPTVLTQDQLNELGQRLLKLTPSGSEYFSRHGDGYKVDVEAVMSAVEDRCRQRPLLRGSADGDVVEGLTQFLSENTHPNSQYIDDAAAILQHLRSVGFQRVPGRDVIHKVVSDWIGDPIGDLTDNLLAAMKENG